jgi:hypothetical protein
VDVNMKEFEEKLKGDTRKEKLIELLRTDYNIAI